MVTFECVETGWLELVQGHVGGVKDILRYKQ